MGHYFLFSFDIHALSRLPRVLRGARIPAESQAGGRKRDAAGRLFAPRSAEPFINYGERASERGAGVVRAAVARERDT